MGTDKESPTFTRSLPLLLLGIAALVAVDQVTKILAVKHLSDGPCVLIDGVFELRYLENHGAAFGVFQGAQVFFLIVTFVFLLIATAVFFRVPAKRRLMPFKLCLLLMMGGAVGNLIDRFLFGYVRDFIYFKLIDFPIFNVADICVTVSAFLLAFLVLFKYKDEDLAFLGLRGNVDKKSNE